MQELLREIIIISIRSTPHGRHVVDKYSIFISTIRNVYWRWATVFKFIFNDLVPSKESKDINGLIFLYVFIFSPMMSFTMSIIVNYYELILLFINNEITVIKQFIVK